MSGQKPWEPALIFEEYNHGKQFKNTLCKRGMYEQSRINERFYAGDQWHGAETGEKPLMRYNILRRIGEYKMAMVGGAGVAVNYSAEGVPNTQGIKDSVRKHMDVLRDTPEMYDESAEMPSAERINMVMSAMSSYFKTTAERVKLDDLKNTALKKAYISGTGVVYTYWDERVKTGLYADMAQQSPILGDLRCEVLDIENVYFGDPNLYDVQEQPYIIIAQRKSVAELKRAARRNKRPAEVIDSIKPDRTEMGYMAGDRAENEPEESKKATVLTKLWKEWDEDGKDYKLMAVEVVQGAIIRKPWDMKIRLYPIARMVWEDRANCAYGDSEITYLIPNQITVNRSIVAATQALIAHGMPIMLVDGDVVTGPVTNDPGQIIRVFGANGGINGAIGYAQAPVFSPQFDNMVNSLMQNTLTQSGANEAALGDMKPDNASAIMAMREAATRPLQLLQNRFYSFIEDIARIWAEFWVTMYGKRSLKIEDEQGEWYMPFDGEEYRQVLITARVDVGAAGLWSEIQTQQTLDNMLQAGLLDPLQYLERLPKGSVPNLGGLIQVYRERTAAQAKMPTDDAGAAVPNTPAEPDMEAVMGQLSPEYQQAFATMSPEQQNQVIAAMMGQQ